jgi:hypothetical protein
MSYKVIISRVTAAFEMLKLSCGPLMSRLSREKTAALNIEIDGKGDQQ